MWNPLVFSSEILGLSIEVRLFGVLAMVIASFAYRLYVKATKSGIMHPSRSSWCLWFVLDSVALASNLSCGVFDSLLFVFTIGTLVISCYSLKYGEKKWEWIDTASTVGALLAIAMWVKMGPAWAVVCSLSGLTVAAWPTFKKVRRGAYEDLTSWCLIAVSTLMDIFDGQILVGIWFLILQGVIIGCVVYHYPPWKRRPVPA